MKLSKDFKYHLQTLAGALSFAAIAFLFLLAIIMIVIQPDSHTASGITVLSSPQDTIFHYEGDLRAWEGICTTIKYEEGYETKEYKFCNSIVILEK